MNRSRTLAPLALCLALAVGACSGGDEPEAKPTKTTASPTPTVPVQPEGEFGVTYDVQNWDEIAKDDAKLEIVTAWKKANEALSASTNSKKINAAARQGLTKSYLRQYTKSAKYAWSNGFKVSDTAIARIQDVRTTGKGAVVTACLWAPSASLRKNGKVVGGNELVWIKQPAEMVRSGDRLLLDSAAGKGTCKGLRAP